MHPMGKGQKLRLELLVQIGMEFIVRLQVVNRPNENAAACDEVLKCFEERLAKCALRQHIRPRAAEYVILPMQMEDRRAPVAQSVDGNLDAARLRRDAGGAHALPFELQGKRWRIPASTRRYPPASRRA